MCNAVINVNVDDDGYDAYDYDFSFVGVNHDDSFSLIASYASSYAPLI